MLWEEIMGVTRRNLAITGAVALGAASLLRGSAVLADASDEAAVKENVKALRKALLMADKAQLEQLAADQLSYGHSSGKVQNKAEFVDGVVTRKAVVKSLDFPELTVAVAGDAAIARHLYVSDSETDGKPDHTRIGMLAVWQKQDGSWKLLARQGYKLT
jgi:ketosteroid isomerase-like protein